MGTGLTLACIIGFMSVGIITGRRIARQDSIQLNVAMGFACFLSVGTVLAFFHDNLGFVACVVSLAVSAIAAAWTQSGGEQDGRQKERDDIAARQRELNGPFANQPYIGDGTVSRQASQPVNRFGAALTGFRKPLRRGEYPRLAWFNHKIPAGRKGKAKLRSVNSDGTLRR